MKHNPLVWIGLIQAYLLMTILAVLLIIGSREANPRKWNVVGALAHCPPLIAALSSLAYSRQWERSEWFEWLLRFTLAGFLLKRLQHFIRTRMAPDFLSGTTGVESKISSMGKECLRLN